MLACHAINSAAARSGNGFAWLMQAVTCLSPGDIARRQPFPFVAGRGNQYLYAASPAMRLAPLLLNSADDADASSSPIAVAKYADIAAATARP